MLRGDAFNSGTQIDATHLRGINRINLVSTRTMYLAIEVGRRVLFP